MKASVVILLTAVVLAGCRNEPEEQMVETQSPPATTAPASHHEEVSEWQRTRLERLKAEDSWLTLVGLHWLKEGENRFGSDRSANTVVLPKNAPPSAGTLTLKDGSVTLRPSAQMTIDGKPAAGAVALRDDTHDNGPTIVQMGTMQFYVIKRSDRYALRVKDSQAETRTHFAGLEYFPIDPKWRVEARFEPYDPPKKIPIADVTGTTSDMTSPGALVFTVDGREYRLDPVLEDGSERLFLIFKDETSRDTTYPAGRYLYADMPGMDGRTVVDFNRSYNPPCAFTDFATCPLPPPQNRLPVRIEAGEKKYAGGHA